MLHTVIKTRYKQLEHHKKISKKHPSSNETVEDAWKASFASFKSQMDKIRDEETSSVEIQLQQNEKNLRMEDIHERKNFALSEEDAMGTRECASPKSDLNPPANIPTSKKKKKRKPKKVVTEGTDAIGGPQPGQFLVDLEANIVKEINDVLSDAKTDRQMVKRLEGYLKDLIRSEKLPPQAYKAPFWKPEKLQDMGEVGLTLFL